MALSGIVVSKLLGERIAFAVSFIAVEIFLLLSFLPLAVYVASALCSSGGLDFEVLKTPQNISRGIDALLFLAFLTPLKPFELFFFKALASAGFFGYLAYCDSADVWPVALMWIAAAMLTRRCGLALAAVWAAVALTLRSITVFPLNF